MGKKISEQGWEMRNNEDVTYLRMDVPAVFVDPDELNKNVVIIGDPAECTGCWWGKTPIYFIVKDGELVHVTTPAKLIVQRASEENP